MRHLKFNYTQKIQFQGPVNGHQFVYRCIPKCQPRQEITNLKVDVIPCDFWVFSEDGFENTTIYGSMLESHREFYISVSGIAHVDWTKYDTSTKYNELYSVPTMLTNPGISMRNYMRKIQSYIDRKSKNYEKACELNDWIYDYFTYTPGVTSVNTTGEQAFIFGKGVCQDYAHVMIGMCRHLGIPARYVSGIMIGEGYSHAWVEIYSKDRWYGFDPTNHRLVDDTYIVFARGRDSSDCVINKGSYFGRYQEAQEIKAFVEEII